MRNNIENQMVRPRDDGTVQTCHLCGGSRVEQIDYKDEFKDWLYLHLPRGAWGIYKEWKRSGEVPCSECGEL